VNGWAFTGNTSDDRAGHFTIDKPRESNRLTRVVPTRHATRTQATSPEPTPITGPIVLARLPEPEQEPPAHLPSGTWLDYSSEPKQWVKVLVDGNGKKSHIPHHIDADGEAQPKAGPDPWPLWREAAALEHGPGLWIAEAEGEKCARWLQAGGLVAISQPGHAHRVEQIVPRYQRLVEAGVLGIVYLEDNDEEGRRRSKQSQEAAAAVGLPLLVLPAAEVWPGLPEKGSIDDADGTAIERVQALEAAIALALEQQEPQQAAVPADEIWPDDESEEDELSPDCQLNLSDKLAEGRKIFTFESLLPAELAAAVELLQRPLPTDPLSAVLPLLCGYSGILKLGTRVSSSLSFEKPVNLYVACVMRTGGAKTSIKNILVDNPAKSIRREMAQEHRRQMQEWESLDSKNRPDAPRPVFVHLSDYTPAALSLQLQRSEQMGLGQLIIRDELSALFASLNADAKHGTGTADSQLLEAFDGEGYTSIRVNEPPRSYDSCHVSVYGNIQPDVLKLLINDDDATGKFARFLFCRVPSRPLELLDDDPTDEEISRHRAAEAVLQDYAGRLFQLPPRTYHFSREARSRFHAWFREHNARAQVDGCPKVVSALLGKTSAHALRLAGILHLIYLVAGHVEMRDPIAATTVDMAMAIVDQLTQETEAFHEQEETDEMRLMRHIHQTSQFSGKPVSLQDARAKAGRAFREQLTAPVFQDCIEKLQQRGYGSVERPGDTSRRRASRYLAIKEVA
jgi:hypothetical protein